MAAEVIFVPKFVVEIFFTRPKASKNSSFISPGESSSSTLGPAGLFEPKKASRKLHTLLKRLK